MDISQLRTDGRFSNELRKLTIEQHTIENKTYVTFSQGLTKVRTSISQNKEKGQVGVLVNFSELSRNEPLNDRRVYEMKTKIASIFNDAVSSDFQIDINIDILQDNGSLFSVIINSITLCLCYCGISINDMILSLTCNNYTDLIYEEEKNSCCVVMSANFNKILYFHLSGKCQKSDIQVALKNAISGIEKINYEIRKYLSNIVNK